MPIGIGLGIDLVKGGKVAAFSPSSLLPTLWEKADAGAYSDAGVTLATNGQTLQQYNDQSANANNASQGTAANRPTWVANVVGSLPMIQPDATNDVMTLGSAISAAGDFTVYLAGTRAAASAYVPLGHSVGSSFMLWTAGTTFFVGDAGGGSVSGTVTPTAGTLLLRVRRSGTTIKVAATGQAEVTFAGSLSGTVTFNSIMAHPAGGNFNGGTNKHGELIVFASTDLPTSNAAGDTSIKSYLAARWGVTLP